MSDAATDLRLFLLPRAKRRLALHGPGTADFDSLFETYWITAGELRLSQTVSRSDAVASCRRIPFPEAEPPLPRERILVETVKHVWDEPKRELFTGCARDPNPRGGADRRKLNARFGLFCDLTCVQSCPILRARFGELARGAFGPALLSSRLWIKPGPLGGELGLAIYEYLAMQQRLVEDETIEARTHDIAARLGRGRDEKTVRTTLRKLEDAGLIETWNQVKGLRRVLPKTPEEIAEIERSLGLDKLVLSKPIEKHRGRVAEIRDAVWAATHGEADA